jgi:hypothetical protein
MWVMTEDSPMAQYRKSPASLTPAEKIQLLEEMGFNLDKWKGLFANGKEMGVLTLRQYIEESSAEQGEEMK